MKYYEEKMNKPDEQEGQDMDNPEPTVEIKDEKVNEFLEKVDGAVGEFEDIQQNLDNGAINFGELTVEEKEKVKNDIHTETAKVDAKAVKYPWHKKLTQVKADLISYHFLPEKYKEYENDLKNNREKEIKHKDGSVETVKLNKDGTYEVTIERKRSLGEQVDVANKIIRDKFNEIAGGPEAEKAIKISEECDKSVKSREQNMKDIESFYKNDPQKRGELIAKIDDEEKTQKGNMEEFRKENIDFKLEPFKDKAENDLENYGKMLNDFTEVHTEVKDNLKEYKKTLSEANGTIKRLSARDTELIHGVEKDILERANEVAKEYTEIVKRFEASQKILEERISAVKTKKNDAFNFLVEIKGVGRTTKERGEIKKALDAKYNPKLVKIEPTVVEKEKVINGGLFSGASEEEAEEWEVSREEGEERYKEIENQLDGKNVVSDKRSYVEIQKERAKKMNERMADIEKREIDENTTGEQTENESHEGIKFSIKKWLKLLGLDNTKKNANGVIDGYFRKPFKNKRIVSIDEMKGAYKKFSEEFTFKSAKPAEKQEKVEQALEDAFKKIIKNYKK